MAHDMQREKLAHIIEQNNAHNAQQQYAQQQYHHQQAASMNQSSQGLNKAFSKVLNTLSNDNANFSR